jgi:hypothetical protein
VQSPQKFLTGLAVVALIAAVVIGLRVILNTQNNSKPDSVEATSPSGASAEGVGLLNSKASLSSPAPVPITERDRQLDGILTQILASKNDNDKRLDTEFKNLSPGTKYLLKQKYASLPAEARNERGTIVFLLGRDLASSGTAADFQFFDQVGAEPPCRSLGDCSQETKAGPEDSHEETAIGVTLSYPQQVLLHTLQDYLSQQQPGQNSQGNLVGPALHTLQVMVQSGNPAVTGKAQEISNRYSHLKP